MAIESNLPPMLQAMHEEVGGVGLVFPEMPSLNHGGPADKLRQDLRRAGITRAELLESTKTSKQLSFHDLRATGLTWMAVRGDNAFKIEQRGRP